MLWSFPSLYISYHCALLWATLGEGHSMGRLATVWKLSLFSWWVLMRIVIMVNYYDDDDVVIAKTLFFMMTCLQWKISWLPLKLSSGVDMSSCWRLATEGNKLAVRRFYHQHFFTPHHVRNGWWNTIWIYPWWSTFLKQGRHGCSSFKLAKLQPTVSENLTLR